MMENKADLRGIFIPEILFKLDIEINKLEDNDILSALIDDSTAEDWIIRWAHKNGHDVLKTEKVATGINIEIKKGGYLLD